MTTISYRISICSLVSEHYFQSANHYTIQQLYQILGCFSPYKLRNLLLFLDDCVSHSIYLDFDFLVNLVVDYNLSSTYHDFAITLRGSCRLYQPTLSDASLGYILNYFNLTFDESVSTITGVDTPVTE